MPSIREKRYKEIQVIALSRYGTGERFSTEEFMDVLFCGDYFPDLAHDSLITSVRTALGRRFKRVRVKKRSYWIGERDV